MQNIVIDKPYAFVAPRRGKFWAWVFRSLRSTVAVRVAFRGREAEGLPNTSTAALRVC